MTTKNRKSAEEPEPTSAHSGDIAPPPGYTPPPPDEPVQSVDASPPDEDNAVHCINCGSADVVLEVKDDPSVSDAAYCAQHRPANR